MRFIFSECLTICMRRHFSINARNMNSEKTQSNTLVALLDRPM